MDEVGTSRNAAREAVRDVEPQPLRTRIDDVLAEASMAPGVLTARCARAVDASADLDALVELIAGVQLSYDGLRLTRQLVHEEPWVTDEEQLDPNLDVLVADVLVARGFSLLARTPAVDKSVEMVRAFGSDQTHRHEAGDDAPRLDRALELNALQLAVIAGTTAVGGSVTPELREQATRIGRSSGVPLAPAEEILPKSTALEVAVGGPEPRPDEAIRRSATDP